MRSRALVMLSAAVASGACWSLSGFSGGEEAGDAGTDAPSEGAPADAGDGGPDVVDATSDADAALVPGVIVQPPVRDDAEAVDLTAIGTLDWTQRGKTAGDRCAPCTPWIGALTSPQPMYEYSPDSRTFQWSNGSPRATATVVDGLFIEGIGSRFVVRTKSPGVPARFLLWLDTFFAGGTIAAMLENAPETTQTATLPPLDDAIHYRVAIDFIAPDSGALVVTYTETTVKPLTTDAAGTAPNIAVIASALSPRP